MFIASVLLAAIFAAPLSAKATIAKQNKPGQTETEKQVKQTLENVEASIQKVNRVITALEKEIGKLEMEIILLQVPSHKIEMKPEEIEAEIAKKQKKKEDLSASVESFKKMRAGYENLKMMLLEALAETDQNKNRKQSGANP